MKREKRNELNQKEIAYISLLDQKGFIYLKKMGKRFLMATPRGNIEIMQFSELESLYNFFKRKPKGGKYEM